MSIERITVALDSEEAAALRSMARTDLRRPQEQARFILRASLLGDKAADKVAVKTKTNSKRAVLVEGGGAFAG